MYDDFLEDIFHQYQSGKATLFSEAFADGFISQLRSIIGGAGNYIVCEKHEKGSAERDAWNAGAAASRNNGAGRQGQRGLLNDFEKSTWGVTAQMERAGN